MRKSGTTQQVKEFPCLNPECKNIFKKHRQLVLHMKESHGVEI